MWKLFTILLMSFVLTSEGLDNDKANNSDSHIASGYDSTSHRAECIHLSRKLDCGFYNCLQKRFPCPDTLITMKSPHVYCYTSKEQGNFWINSILNCYMANMRNTYLTIAISCRTVDDIFLDIQRRCFIENAICLIGWTNRELLWNLFKKAETKPLSRHYKMLWKNIGTVVSNCKTRNYLEFEEWINSRIPLL